MSFLKQKVIILAGLSGGFFEPASGMESKKMKEKRRREAKKKKEGFKNMNINSTDIEELIVKEQNAKDFWKKFWLCRERWACKQEKHSVTSNYWHIFQGNAPSMRQLNKSKS